MSLNPANLRVNWNYPTAVRFGPGRAADLPDVCKQLGMSRPLLVTDPGVASLPFVAEIVARNEAAGLPTGVFSDVQGNPIGANVDDGVAAFKAGGHDGVIALGGGSALDVGKAVALMVGQDRPLWDFEDREDWFTRVNVAGMAPCVAVPTTSGTGSEVGRCSVILDLSDHTKKIIFHPKMLPSVVVADPALTVALPPHLTAWTGMDALSHSLEAYMSPFFHPMGDGVAVEGIRLVKEYLPTACRDGKDIGARAAMMVASTMGATAFQKGLGAMHALSHPAGAVLNTQHGLTNAVVMPYVIAFNRPAVEDKLTRLAAWLELPNPSAQAVLDWVLALRAEIGIPHTLAEIGVTEAHIPTLAPMAVVDPSAGTNPIPLDEANVTALYTAAIRGELG